MKLYSLGFSIFLLLISACKRSEKTDDLENWKAEIITVEKAFNDMAQEKGLEKAFEFYAAKDGVIRRGKNIIKGKQAIGNWYKEDVKPNETLSWIPTFVDVSASGDMAFTYGDYTFSYLDSLGNKKVSKGIFHTVWKRQKDGSWRSVSD